MRVRAHRLIAHLRRQWMGALALFMVLTGGVAYAADTIGSSDIIDEAILSQDVKNGEVMAVDIANNQVFAADVRNDTLPNGGLGSVDIANGQLNDEDVGEAQFVDFTRSIGVVQGNDCVYRRVTGLPVDNKDHLVLTAEVTTSETELIYTPKWHAVEAGDMWIQVCNVSGAALDDRGTRFNLLVVDAGD